MRNTLLAVDGIEDVAIDFDKKVAYVKPVSDGPMDPDPWIDALKAEGYGANLRADP